MRKAKHKANDSLKERFSREEEERCGGAEGFHDSGRIVLNRNSWILQAFQQSGKDLWQCPSSSDCTVGDPQPGMEQGPREQPQALVGGRKGWRQEGEQRKACMRDQAWARC